LRAGVVSAKTAAALSKLKAVALDVDGVLTDDTFGWDADGVETKRFAFLDVMGVSRATKAGVVFALVSGEATSFVDRYATKMKIGDVFQGTKDKASSVREFAARHGISTEEILFVGNDINDLDAMAICGLSAAPIDAHDSVIERVDYVSKRPGGHGAVREVLDLLLNRDVQKSAGGDVPVRPVVSTFFRDELEAHHRVLETLVTQQASELEHLQKLFTVALTAGRKLLFCGNGGSAADSQHIAAEFINRFRFDRPALPALALTVDTSVLTCIGNDSSYDFVFSRQVEALAEEGDVVVGLSTSGRSKNVLLALEAARKKKALAVGLTGKDGAARMKDVTDFVLGVPSNDTARIQEGHEFALHCVAALVENAIFENERPKP
jgi:D-sedoheptulose 7-phosphate isomerase